MKYGIKTIMRSRVRTALFLVLILFASLFLSTGVSIWVSSQDMLGSAEDVYITAGDLVYQGGHYPESGVYDPALAKAVSDFDILSLSGLPGALLVEENLAHRVYVEDYKMRSDEMPYKGFSIVETELISQREGNPDVSFFANVTDTIFSSGVDVGGAVYFFGREGEAEEYQPGRKYLIAGQMVTLAGRTNKCLQPKDYSDLARDTGGPGTAYPTAVDITEYTQADKEAFWQGEAGRHLVKLCDMIEVVNNSVTLVASAKMEAVEEFHHGEYTLKEGRFFTEEEYESGNACILPSHVSDALGLKTGDTVELNIHRATGSVGIYASYWPDTGFAARESCRVAGIYTAKDAGAPIYMPNAGQDWLGHSQNDYVLGRVVIQNGMADAFMAAVEDLLPNGVTLTLYDQGYENALVTVEGMKETAFVIIAVSAIACLVILLFFGYVFVSRSAVSASVLMHLGAGGRRVWLYLVSGAGSITIASALTGVGASFALSGILTNWVYDTARSVDRRFSLGRGAQTVILAPRVSLWPFLFVTALIVCVSVLICSLFAFRTIRGQDAHHRLKIKHRRIKRRKKPGEDMRRPRRALGVRWAGRIPGQSLRYGIKTMLRGGGRAFVTTIAFAVLLCAIGVMGGMKKGYEDDLAEVYGKIPVTVHFTDSKGRMVDGLSIQQSSMRELEKFDFVAESWYSRNVRYHYAGLASSAAGAPSGEGPDWVEIPTAEFAYETFVNQLNTRFELLVLSDNPAYTAEYFYSGAPEVVWLDGYDWETYKTSARWESHQGKDDMGYTYTYYMLEGNPAVLAPQSFLDAHGLSLGDRIWVQWFQVQNYGWATWISSYNLEVPIAGVLIGQNLHDTLYLPSALIHHDPENNYYESYHAAGALLRHTDKLSEIRDQLATKFAQVNAFTGRTRIWVYIDDTELYQTIAGFLRYINYIDVLYPAILAISVGLGFLIANLLLRGRRREIALLRSVGTGNAKVFWSLFWEQLFLCVPGVLLGLGGVFAVMGTVDPGQTWKLGLFALCYLLGAAAAIWQTQRVALMQNLMERE